MTHSSWQNCLSDKIFVQNYLIFDIFKIKANALTSKFISVSRFMCIQIRGHSSTSAGGGFPKHQACITRRLIRMIESSKFCLNYKFSGGHFHKCNSKWTFLRELRPIYLEESKSSCWYLDQWKVCSGWWWSEDQL